MSDESKTPVSPEESAGSKESSPPSEGASADAPSPPPSAEAPAEGEAKKSGGFDFLTALLVVVVLLNVVFFLYNSYADKPPANPTGGPPPQPAESPVGQAESPQPPVDRPILEVLTPEEETKVILKAAQDFDFKNPRLLLALMALNSQPEPIGLSLQQKQRFLVEFAAKRLDRSVDSIVASQLGDVFEGAGLNPAKAKGTGTPAERLSQAVALLTRIQAKATPKPFRAREVGFSKRLKSVDEACVTLLELDAKGKDRFMNPDMAAELLAILHPILAAGTPSLTEAQQTWIQKNQGTEKLSFETWLKPLGLPTYDDSALTVMQDHVRSLLAGIK